MIFKAEYARSAPTTVARVAAIIPNRNDVSKDWNRDGIWKAVRYDAGKLNFMLLNSEP